LRQQIDLFGICLYFRKNIERDIKMEKHSKKYTVKIGGSNSFSTQRKEAENIGVNPPLASLFLGPHAENSQYWEDAISTIFKDYVYWRKNYYSKDGNLMGASDYQKGDDFHREFLIYLETMLNDLKQSFPFHSPRYMGHMLSEQTLPAVMGYFATMLYNPNNVTEEAAPVTVEKELDFGKRICQMLGYGSRGWAHLCSGGSSANLEALWAARQSQFFSLVLRDVCQKNGWNDFTIKLPNHRYTNTPTYLCACSDRQLLHLHPSESLFMLKNLTHHLHKNKRLGYDEIKRLITEAAAVSEYNIRTNGYANVISKIGLKPVIFVSQSAHYSVKKATNLLGYGECSIRPIPTTDKFRIDISALKKLLDSVKEDEYIAAVIAVFGTTEEGAIDPVHRVKWLRDSLAMEKNLSFWIHVDAAWGGYFAVMKNESPYSLHDKVDMDEKDFFDRVDQYISRINVSETYEMSYDADFPNYKETYKKPQKLVSWNDREVFAAMFALCDADSITVDPHKMGYIPYPAGVVAFKNKRIIYLLKEHASYIGTDSKNFNSANNNDEDMNFYLKDDLFNIPQIGAYTLEGSRPGAAAMACWFASEIIPLDIKNHGKIIRTTVLNARRFAQYLQQHSSCTFRYIDEKLQQQSDNLGPCNIPFKIELLYNNIDTNLVCFFVRPCKWLHGTQSVNGRWKMIPDDSWSLDEINELNRHIHERLTISPSREADQRKNSLNQKFYVAGTNLEVSKYSAMSMKVTLNRFGFSEDEYTSCGLYVMRSTIMNPWYYKAAQSDNHIDYFMQFLEELHYAARKVIDSSIDGHIERMYPIMKQKKRK